MEAAEDATSDEHVEEEAQLAARREENIRALLSNKYVTLQALHSCSHALCMHISGSSSWHSCVVAFGLATEAHPCNASC
jgi:hypothetical protein